MKKLLTILLILFSLQLFAQDGILSINGNLLVDTSGNFLNYFPVPRQNLEAKFDTTYKNSNGDLLNLAGGANAVYISGTGLDAIYDFSGLNDLRFNKNAYLGNSFSLPEYYDYPYTDIYFDTNNPYYWKLTDFHYANFLKQSLTVDNIAFLKAKATTNTSNIIASVQELLVYSVAQTSTNLTRIKTYIGIQADFYSDELLNNTGFEGTYVSGLAPNWNITGKGTVSEENSIIVSGESSQKIIIDPEGGGRVYQEINAIKGLPIKITGNLYSISINTNLVASLRKSDQTFIDVMQLSNAINQWLNYNYLYTPDSNFSLWVCPIDIRTVGQSGILYADDVSAKYFYQNYYKQ